MVPDTASPTPILIQSRAPPLNSSPTLPIGGKPIERLAKKLFPEKRPVKPIPI